MKGETDLDRILKSMSPQQNKGEYVFCSIRNLLAINMNDVLLLFKEPEGITIVIKKELADHMKLDYSFIASWITLTVHSSLEAVGLTAAFSKALSGEGISCNVVAAYYHDHIFVNKKDTNRAMTVLNRLSE